MVHLKEMIYPGLRHNSYEMIQTVCEKTALAFTHHVTHLFSVWVVEESKKVQSSSVTRVID